MLGLVMGQDAVDLFSFTAKGRVLTRVVHTGLLPLQWSADSSGWQVGGSCWRGKRVPPGIGSCYNVLELGAACGRVLL